DLTDQNLFFIVRSFGNHAPERVTQERPAPELKACSFGGGATNGAVLLSHAGDHCDVYAVRYRMCALNGPPGIVLRNSELLCLRRMPANCGRIKQHYRALQRRQPRSLRIPLVPADQGSEFSSRSIKSAEAQISRGEIIFLVIQRIVGDVHFSI